MIPLLAAAAALSFAPPAGRPIVYRTTETRPTPAGDQRYTLRQSALFTRDAGGWLLTVRSLGYTLEAPAAQRPVLDALMKPMIGNPVRLHLTADGVPERVIDGAATWAAFVAGVRASAAASGKPEIARAAEALAALPAAQRDAQLLELADDIVAPRLPPLRPGQIVATGTDTVSRDADSGGALHFHRLVRRPAPTGTGVLATDEDVRVGPGDGLVRRRTRATTLQPGGTAAPVPITRTETVRLP